VVTCTGVSTTVKSNARVAFQPFVSVTRTFTWKVPAAGGTPENTPAAEINMEAGGLPPASVQT